MNALVESWRVILAVGGSPLVPWILAAVLVTSWRIAWRSLRRQMRLTARQHAEEIAAVKRVCSRLEDLLLDAERRLQEAEERSKEPAPPPTARASLNLSKRTQAARMFRRGEQPEQIAAALSLPRSEVDLLLKVQKAASGG